MPYELLADAIVILHLAFVAFAVLGGLLVVRWRRVAWVHLPAAAWGAWIEFADRVCPLTPLENQLRRASGDAGYGGGFIDHYVAPLVYPAGLTRGAQVALGVLALGVNACIYGVVLMRILRRSRTGA